MLAIVALAGRGELRAARRRTVGSARDFGAEIARVDLAARLPGEEELTRRARTVEERRPVREVRGAHHAFVDRPRVEVEGADLLLSAALRRGHGEQQRVHVAI